MAVQLPLVSRLDNKRRLPIEILYLGRVVPAKGVLEALKALAELRERDLPQFHLRIAGNLEYSDPDYCDTVRKFADEKLADVDFIGTVDPERRDDLLCDAHILVIPSYHEGFCKPVIEGLRAGCIPVGYAAHNLRYIADGLCRMVPPGNIDKLAAALAEMIIDVATSLQQPQAKLRLDRGSLTSQEFARASIKHVTQFEPENISALLRRHVALLLGRQDTKIPAPELGGTSTASMLADSAF